MLCNILFTSFHLLYLHFWLLVYPQFFQNIFKYAVIDGYFFFINVFFQTVTMCELSRAVPLRFPGFSFHPLTINRLRRVGLSRRRWMINAASQRRPDASPQGRARVKPTSPSSPLSLSGFRHGGRMFHFIDMFFCRTASGVTSYS